MILSDYEQTFLQYTAISWGTCGLYTLAEFGDLHELHVSVIIIVDVIIVIYCTELIINCPSPMIS